MDDSSGKGPPIKKFRIKLVSIKNKRPVTDDSTSVPIDTQNIPISTSQTDDSISIPSNPPISNDLRFGNDGFNNPTILPPNDQPIAQPQPTTQIHSNNNQLPDLIDGSKSDSELCGYDGLYFSSKTQPDSASDAGSAVSLAARSAVSSVAPFSKSGTRALPKGKFKLKIRKIAPTPITDLKGIIDESYHYELPVGDVCITSGVYFDKHFFDVIYPGKTLSTDLGIFNKNTKSHFLMDRNFHKHRMSMLPCKFKSNENDKAFDKTKKISFTIAKNKTPTKTSKDGIKHLFYDDNSGTFDLPKINNSKSIGNHSSNFERELLDFINENQPLSIDNNSKPFVSQISFTVPTCVTNSSLNSKKVLARKIINLGYIPITESSLLPDLPAESKFVTCILKSQFIKYEKTHLFYSVDSSVSAKISLDAPFSPSDTFRFITTTIRIINLSSSSSDMIMEFAMNDDSSVSESLNYRYGLKRIQVLNECKFSPPANYASLLYESFHRALHMRRANESPQLSLEANHFLEVVWRHFNKNGLSLLQEIDSLLHMDFEMDDVANLRIVIFTPKKCAD